MRWFPKNKAGCYFQKAFPTETVHKKTQCCQDEEPKAGIQQVTTRAGANLTKVSLPTCQVLCQWSWDKLASICRVWSRAVPCSHPLCLQLLFFTAAAALQGEPFGSGAAVATVVVGPPAQVLKASDSVTSRCAIVEGQLSHRANLPHSLEPHHHLPRRLQAFPVPRGLCCVLTGQRQSYCCSLSCPC